MTAASPSSRVSLGELLLALDSTMVALVGAPRGLDLPVGSATLVDSDDVRLGLAPGAGNADLYLFVGVDAGSAQRWLDAQERLPIAMFVKEPPDTLVRWARSAGTAVVSVDPRARWERLYNLVNHVFEHRGDPDDPRLVGGTDLFGLAQSIADRARGMVSIEDAASHVLAYSASNEEADELRRLSILGRAGPVEHLEWIAQWGIFDALRAGGDVVRVAERPELGLRPRMAVGIHLSTNDSRRTAEFGGTIWLQQGTGPLSDDADEVLRGGAVLAARILSRLAAVPSTHAARVRQLLGLAETTDDVTTIARDLGVAAEGRAALIGFGGNPPPPADVIALSASAFRADAQVTSANGRVYVLLPKTGAAAAVTSWTRGIVATLHRELGLTLRAVTAAPLPGLAEAAPARQEMDRVFDSAARHPDAIDQVTSLGEARATVALDEIVSLVAGNDRLIDPRTQTLRERDPLLAQTLRVYLDSFGDVGAAAHALHVHPNTVRYRVRRIEEILSTSLTDPDTRLLLSLGLRATGH